jgi:hypothetical protein
LKDAIAGSKKLPSRLVVHSQAGAGKTTFATFAPSPFFLLSPGETGIHSLIDGGLVKETPNLEVATWAETLGVIDELTTTEHAYRTLVLDTIDGFERLCNQHVCDTDFGGDWGEKGFMSFHRGFKVAASGPWRGLLASLDKLREAKRMGIILLAHTGISNFQNPAGPDFNRYSPDMYKDAWQLTFGWCDICLFGHREIFVEKEKGDRKPKGAGGERRVFYTEWSAFADAKNRHNLPAEVDMGNSGQEAWDNFIGAIAQGKKAKETA